MTLSLSLESSVRLHFHRLRAKLGEKERVILCNSEGDWTNIEKLKWIKENVLNVLTLMMNTVLIKLETNVLFL